MSIRQSEIGEMTKGDAISLKSLYALIRKTYLHNAVLEGPYTPILYRFSVKASVRTVQHTV
jgi:hypothetical protein